MKESDYLLTNSEPETGDRFDGLEQAFDAVSIGHLQRLGIGSGARCLEIGAGSGSIARWLADQVGPAGRVVATDLDVRWLRHARRLISSRSASSTWSTSRSPTDRGTSSTSGSCCSTCPSASTCSTGSSPRWRRAGGS